MRFSWPSALLGAAAVLLVPAVLGGLMVTGGYTPVNADAKPPAIEKALAIFALRRTIARLNPGEAPLSPSDVVLTHAVQLYGRNCATCHGASDGRPTTVAVGLYQSPPQFAKDGVDDDPVGETYLKIRHGIRFTGMPAYSHTLSDREAWTIALFLKHLPALPPHAQAAWKALRSPGQLAPQIPD